MKRNELNRRDFNRLTMAALGGVVAGTAIGCGGGDDDKTTSETPGPAGGEPKEVVDNACRGLNACSDKGKGDHDCAGMGECASVAAHDCATKNSCKNLGGCGETAGSNDCTGKGECAIPMVGDTWKQAREAFEARMKESEQKFGDAPPPPA